MDLLQTSFWFVPMVMLGLSGALAWALLAVDRRFDPGSHAALEWAYTGGAEGARSLLSTIAGSMITAASVTFSLAAVALSISSQQYGSRVLRNFMRDKVTQFLLGTFVSTFLYCVLVVRTIRGSNSSGGFVPAVSVTVAIAMTLASLVLLVYFIHHISASIQASHIVRVIAEDMRGAVAAMYPAMRGEGTEDGERLREVRQGESLTLRSRQSGYLQSVDVGQLRKEAIAADVVLEVGVKPGDHVVEGEAIVRVWGQASLPAERLDRIQDSFLFGGQRTPLQDIRYPFQQMTEVVVRALSPGINDPFTAVNGIDELTTGMALLMRQERPRSQWEDEKGKLRLILSIPEVTEILDESVGHIAIYGAGDRFVMARLRKLLEIARPNLRGERESETLLRLRKDVDRREQRDAAGEGFLIPEPPGEGRG